MEVFAVTLFVSLMFAVLFAALYLAERSQRRRGSIEQDALLPLDEPEGARMTVPESHSRTSFPHDQHRSLQSPH
ncbi:hypothetical protein [Prosthecobacter sp.]|uniref:hypothetical protein n=1 Tax=Prosthecobacter sp. TaxID=1965333 RepID=UPI002489C662|nr:hypothetical protein [Prosthecobacter sp.]MDI1314198.1 hypothetical protein [Prosthecobacter sp.]